MLKVGYSQLSMVLGLTDAILFDLTKETNPNEKLRLEKYLRNLERHFNSPTKLDAAEINLENVNYDSKIKFAHQTMMFNIQVDSFNARCNCCL